MYLPDPINVLGVRVDPLTKTQLVRTIVTWAEDGERKIVGHVNVHGMNLTHRDERFRDLVNAADLVFCDGHGVLWGARQLGHDLPERLAVMDWIDDLVTELAARDLRVFLLGDEEEIVDLCASIMRTAHPRLQIVGTQHGFFEISGDAEENDRVIEKVNASGADVLLVGMGMPRQEFWIADHRDDLKPSVVLPVGATYRWYAGIEPRAPRWMIDHGLEWVGRLVRHPIRMFKRYIVGNPLFVWRILTERRRRVGSPARQ